MAPNARQWLVAIWSLRVGCATLLAPVFLYWIRVYVTGIPPLGAQMLALSALVVFLCLAALYEAGPSRSPCC
jgi:hypothetical protein